MILGSIIVVMIAIVIFYSIRKAVQSGGFRTFAQRIFVIMVWLTGAAVFLAVMYPMLRAKLLLTFLGSALMIWIGWDRREKIASDGREGKLNGWQTFQKAMRTFGFIALALSSALYVFIRYMMYYDEKHGKFINFLF